jgi:dual oxidase
VLLRIPRDYDLVLELDSLASRRKFIAKLEAFLASQKKHFTLTPIARDIMLAKAETKERRQKKLEQVCLSRMSKKTYKCTCSFVEYQKVN